MQGTATHIGGPCVESYGPDHMWRACGLKSREMSNAGVIAGALVASAGTVALIAFYRYFPLEGPL